MSATSPLTRWPQRLQHAGLLCLVFFACAMPILYLTKQPGGLASLWIANAVACAFLIELPRKHWWLPLCALVSANLSAGMLFGDSLQLSLYFCLANLIESVLAAWLLQQSKLLQQFNASPQKLLKILALACIGPVAAGACIGAWGLQSFGLGDYWELWLLWFAGSCTGMAAMLPLALNWRQKGTRAFLKELDPLLAPAIVLFYLAIATLALLYVKMAFVYLSVPLILIALYCNVITVALANLAGALLFIAMLSLGFFIPPPLTASWQVLFMYPPILGALLPSLLLATSLQQTRLRELSNKHSEQRFRDTLEFSGTGLLLIDQYGNITEANRQLCLMCGFSREELLGSNAIQLLIPESRPVATQNLHGLLSRAQTSYSVDRQVQKKDGTLLWISMNLSTLPHSDGPDEIIVQINDIDSHIKTQQHLEQLRGDAEQSSQAKSAFLANMSHEIRTPMNGVMGIVQLLEHTQLDSTQQQYLRMLNDSGKLLLSVINDILDFSKIESGSLRLEAADFPLDQLVRHVASLMNILAGSRDLQLVIRVDPEVPQTLHADLYRLEQILINLAGNAVKFTEQGSVELHISLLPDQQIHFSIQDTGIGLSQAQQEGLFQPFIQADTSLARKRSGTGLGLAISKRLVAMMGGSIGVNSQLNKGSEFWFSLPLQPCQRLIDPLPALVGLSRVLLLSESQPTCISIASLIGCFGAQFATAANSASALQLLEQAQSEGQPYQLLLIDWSHSSLNGWQCLQALQQQKAIALPATRLLVNGYTQEQLLVQRSQSLNEMILTTPVTRQALHQCLQEALDPSSVERSRSNLLIAATGELNGINLLLVEDNVINQLVAQKALELHGAHVSIAADGQIAIDLLRNQAKDFHAVLMDIQMPGMDGYTATRIIRNELQLTLPILAMSAGVTSSEQAECKAAGMNDFIAKPMNVQNLLSTVHKYLNVSAEPSLATGEAHSEHGLDRPVFDASALDQLCAHSTATRSVMRGLVSGFVEKGDSPIAEIRSALAQDKHIEAASIVHTLRGSLGTLGAQQLTHLSHNLETALKNNASQEIPPLLARFELALQALQLAFTHWLDKEDVNP